MPTFALEEYVNGLTPDDLVVVVDRLREAARQASEPMDAIHHLHSLYIAEDEMCLHVFTGSGPRAVRAVGDRVGISIERIVGVVDQCADQAPPRGGTG
jgi:hypothetical protein